MTDQSEQPRAINNALHMEANDDCVRVAVRVRPLTALEIGTERCVSVKAPATVQIGGSSGPRFTFDRVWDSKTSQASVFDDNVSSLVDSCLEGYNATVLAYGQTGSGKTYTVMGEDGSPGVIPRALTRIFSQLQQEHDEADSRVTVQFLEIYGEHLRDLLQSTDGLKGKLAIRELPNAEPEVVGAAEVEVSSASDALNQLHQGLLRRVTASTAMNQNSSRSHAILSVIIEQHGDVRKKSRFNFVDLAGSERLKRTQAEGQRMKEGIDINKGLLVLGNVIAALADPKQKGKTFVPYRDSKLTRLLKGSLGGNHKTLMIACVSPSEDNMDESLNCLRYANRAKNIKNAAIVNVDATSLLVSELQEHVRTLSSALLVALDGGDPLDDCPYDRSRLENLACGQRAHPTVIKPNHYQQSPLNSLRASDAVVGDHEIIMLQNELKRSQASHEEAEEQLYVAMAKNKVFELQLAMSTSDQGDEPSVVNASTTEKQTEAFLKRAAEYEREIGSLKKALQESDSKLTLAGDNALDVALAQEKKLQSDLKVYEEIRSSLVVEDEESLFVPDVDDSVDVARKYLSPEEDSDGELQPQPITKPPQSQRKLQADLIEISKNIAAKEELIDQLKFSEEKYSNMRLFYEDKVAQMESALNEKENEREQLLLELREMKSGDDHRSGLQEELLEKEKHIAVLRKKHQQLVDLTSVSTNNQSKIYKLQGDIKDMKRKKVDLQKLITKERKDHASELRKLKKDAAQRDRELSKWKKISADKESEAMRASQMAKTRYKELGQLRTKYKDAEKKLRLSSVKRGVMERAGIDPLIVGRRSSPRKGPSYGAVDIETVESLRKLFDDKVAEVVRKDAIVEKLAKEWEVHFELTAKRESSKMTEDDCQALDMQIKFKEDRIRSLASKLQPSPTEPLATFDSQGDPAFLCGDKFRSLTKGSDPRATSSLVAKVLFGMIVKEKRRVAALARTASSLDERLQQVEKEASVSESAFLSYMEAHKADAINQSKQEQERILSLMDLVKDETEQKETATSLTGVANSTLLTLTQQRVESLEKHVADLEKQLASTTTRQSSNDDLHRALESKGHECESLSIELNEMRDIIKQIRSRAQTSSDTAVVNDVVDLTLKALLPSSSGATLVANNKHELTDVCTTDEEVDKEEPAWAADIMKDLALIAEGRVPPSLSKADTATTKEESTVFDRLADPQSFTGTQASRRDTETEAPLLSHNSGNQSDRRAMTKEISSALDQIVVPSGSGPKNSDKHLSDEPTVTPQHSETEAKRSVFERLMSPSQYTGVQRGKHQATKSKRKGIVDEAADKLLDDLLTSDGEEETRDSNQPHETENARGHHNYTQEDVFERLNRTTTQAYAVKHSNTAESVVWDGTSPQASAHRSGKVTKKRGTKKD